MNRPTAGTIAVIGASTDRRKYGNKCVRAYLAAGWTVYPINPGTDTVEGLEAFRSVAELPGSVDRLSVYLPPPLTRRLLPTLPPGAVVFFNPGSATAEVLSEARRLGLDARDACSIVDIGLRPADFPDES